MAQLTTAPSQGRAAPAVRRQILWVTPAGNRERGGMGEITRVALAAFARTPKVERVVVLDPRGTGSRWLSLLYLPLALARAAILGLRRPSILHVHIAARGSTVRKLTFVVAGMLTRTPVVLHLHAGAYPQWFPARPAWQRWLIASLFRRASRVVALSRGWGDFVASGLGVEPSRVLVLENAVFGPPAVERAESGEPCRILYLGRLEEPKGVPELIAALSRLPRGAAWRATLAGSGDVERYKREAEAGGIAGRVDFPGWVEKDDVARLLAATDLLVLPSHFEGMPMSVLEALAYGAAVVCTPVGAVPEFIEDGVSGRLVPIGDVDALAAAIERLVTDPAERRRIAAGGREVWRQRFNAEDYAERLAALYASVVERP
jgi:glycosyltransferase involved in cell wall biosynthesis